MTTDEKNERDVTARPNEKRRTLVRSLGTKRARVTGVAVGAFAVLTSLLVVPGAIAGPESPESEEATSAAERLAKQVQWGSCDAASLEPVPEEDRELYTCADQEVPLDHAKPSGEQISIALIRRAAAEPKRKIGTLVAASGGPGLPSRPLTAAIGYLVDDEVLKSFDIVSFDPRGIGGSTRVECFADPQDEADVFGDMSAVPTTDDEVSSTLDAFARYGEACEQNAGALPQHMSTKDVARDMEWLRVSLRQPQLNYLGISYGTLVGATYANLYPKRVRAMVLDSAVDPVTRTTDGLQQDRERAAGFEDSLDAFLAECEKAGDSCAFSSGDPRKKFDELREHLRKQPIELPDGTSMSISDLTAGIGNSLLSAAAFPSLATELQAAYDLMNPPTEPGQSSTTVKSFELLKSTSGMARFDANQGALEDAEPRPSEYYDAHFSVNCSDKPFTHKQSDVPGIAAEWEKETPTFARYQAFAEAAACPVWPTKSPDRYTGPWDQETRNPILVLGGLHDPATPYEFAERMTKSLGKARLLTVDGFGHGFVGLSKDANSAVATYLTRLRVPEPGTTVELDAPPFPE